MELILITGKKLKIMLSAADMENYRLDCGNLDYDNTETRRAFWSILDEAKHRTGFDAAADRVMIQVYPGKGGGCEMFVTKLSERRGSNVISISGSPVPETGTETLCGIYRFSGLEDLLGACRILDEAGFDGKSDVYASEETPRCGGGKYYLMLYCRRREPGRFSFIGEYGTPCRGGQYEFYIKEHSRPVCTGSAVSVLGRLALK